MIAILLSTCLSLFLFTTFGVFTTKLIKVPSSFVEKILIGFVFCNTITTILSLFFAINIFVLFFLTGLGLLFFLRIKKELRMYIFSLQKNKRIIFYGLLFILPALLISLGSPDNYDSSLYHIQSIKWIEEYPVIPGLANLHGRFGFNPNVFILYALTSISSLFQQEIFSINFTVFAILIFYFIHKLSSLYKQQGFSNLFIFHFFLFLIILRLPNLSSPSPDFLSTTIPLFIFARMLDLSGNEAKSDLKRYIPVLIISIYMLTVKLATIPILILFLFLFIKHKSELKKTLWLIPVLSLIIIPWLIRNIIISGWLIYPFPSLDLFSFDWKVPLEDVIKEKESVTGWARNPGTHYTEAANMTFTDWFPIWWRRSDLFIRLFVVLSLFFPVIVLIGQLFKKIKIDLYANAVIITSFIGVVFWFFFAPCWRFGESFILVASMSPLLVLKSNLKLSINPKLIFIAILVLILGHNTMGKTFIVVALVTILVIYTLHLRKTYYKPNIVFGTLLALFLGSYIKIHYSDIKKNSREMLYSNRMIVPSRVEIPSNMNFSAYSLNGVDIYAPIEDNRCFDHCIPCTPYYPNPTLTLRGNTVKSGFKIRPKDKL